MIADPFAHAMADRSPDLQGLLMEAQRLGKIALVERSNTQIMQRVGLTATVTVLATGRQGALIVVFGSVKVALLAVNRPQTIQNLNKRLEVAIRSRRLILEQSQCLAIPCFRGLIIALPTRDQTELGQAADLLNQALTYFFRDLTAVA